jgi:hypothetical protein
MGKLQLIQDSGHGERIFPLLLLDTGTTGLCEENRELSALG